MRFIGGPNNSHTVFKDSHGIGGKLKYLSPNTNQILREDGGLHHRKPGRHIFHQTVEGHSTRSRTGGYPGLQILLEVIMAIPTPFPGYS